MTDAADHQARNLDGDMTDRRAFLRRGTALALAAPLAGAVPPGSSAKAWAASPTSALFTDPSGQDAKPPAPARPVVIASGNGLKATEKAMALLGEGADPLDAVVAGVNLVEDDPNDNSVGYGGLPNERGVVELDASVMHGPTGMAGAVAALRNIKNPSSVARLVLQRTDHVLLVGEGALEFAKAHGFKEEELLTEEARKIWLKWKEGISDNDDWLPPPEVDDKGRQSSIWTKFQYHYGTINCCAVTAQGEMAGVTTTSGLSFKIPGRVGDSPIIGAGLFVDNEVGAAGSTGRGEAVIQIAGAHTVVELMRQGLSPTEACLGACKRIADKTKLKRLLNEQGRPNFDVYFYALAKDGRHGAASLWSGGKYVVNEGGKNRHEEAAHLFKRGE